MSEPVEEVKAKALDLLSVREHTRAELVRKLTTKGFEPALIHDVLDALRGHDLQSDQRFSEGYAQSRAAKGDGPIKIRYQLKERGVDRDTIASVLAQLDGTWKEGAALARAKRFGAPLPHEFKDRAKQARFLEQRGFSSEQIRAVFKCDNPA